MAYRLNKTDLDVTSKEGDVTGVKLNAQRLSVILNLQRGSWPSDRNRGLPLINIHSGLYNNDELNSIVTIEATKITSDIQNISIIRRGEELQIVVKHG